jgi:hypothetical protein
VAPCNYTLRVFCSSSHFLPYVTSRESSVSKTTVLFPLMRCRGMRARHVMRSTKHVMPQWCDRGRGVEGAQKRGFMPSRQRDKLSRNHTARMAHTLRIGEIDM